MKRIESSVDQTEGVTGQVGVWTPITNNGLPAPMDAGASNVDQVPDYVSAARGALMMLYEDQEFHQVKNENPNLNVPPFMTFLLRLHALGLGYPYELAFMDVGDMSWSAGKTLITLARTSMAKWRTQTFGPTLTHLAMWQVERWADEFNDPMPADASVVWSWPELPWPDPFKEEQTNKLGRENGTTSTRRIEPDWQKIQDEIVEEDSRRDTLSIARIARIQQQCNDANKKTEGLDLNWRQIVALVGATSQPGHYLQASEMQVNPDDPKKKPPKASPEDSTAT